jgi:hypothetical protein
VLERDYRTVRVEAGPDASWHFDVNLPISAQVETTARAATGEAPPATLAKIRLMGSGARIDVIGLRLTGHEDVASWLDEWLEQLGMTPISSRPRTTQHGVMGDILATKRSKGGVTVARYATVREGEHTFVLVLRTPLANYRLVAHEFMLAVSSFRASNDSAL